MLFIGKNNVNRLRGFKTAILDFHILREEFFSTLSSDTHDFIRLCKDASTNGMISSRFCDLIHGVFGINRDKLNNEVMLKIRK